MNGLWAGMIRLSVQVLAEKWTFDFCQNNCMENVYIPKMLCFNAILKELWRSIMSPVCILASHYIRGNSNTL